MSVSSATHGASAATADFHFTDHGSFWVVGLGGVGPYTTARQWVMPLWEEFIRRREELPASVDRSLYISPCHGRETEFTFYVGFASREEIVAPPPGMICIRILAHQYVVGQVRGPRAEIERVYAALPAWAEAHGRSTNKAILWLETYPDGPCHDPDGPFTFDIHLPLR